jgi:tRNA(Arg) A34 adenosine deaminase TadA
MRLAIAEARRADDAFGCVIADLQTGDVLVAAPNVAEFDPTGHAETNALRIFAQRKLDPKRAALVSTAEPCPMCAASCWWAGVPVVVFGTSIATLIASCWRQLDLPMRDLVATAKPPGGMTVVGGYLADETDPLYTAGPRRSKAKS